MTVAEICAAAPVDVQAKFDAHIDARQNALAFGDTLRTLTTPKMLRVRGRLFDGVVAQIATLDMNDVGALTRLQNYVPQLMKFAGACGVPAADIEKTYVAFWR